MQIYTTFNSPERTRAALESLDAADLVVLALPLYVDSLPAPVIASLEKSAAHRAGPAARQRFAAIANCGLPERVHNATALAICSEFARQIGFAWAGSLVLGGGEGLVHGAPLDELDGRAIPIRKALGSTAAALAEGRPIPHEAHSSTSNRKRRAVKSVSNRYTFDASASENGPTVSPRSVTMRKLSISALLPMARVQKPTRVTCVSAANSISIHAPSPSPSEDHCVAGSPSIAWSAPKATSSPSQLLLIPAIIAPACAEPQLVSVAVESAGAVRGVTSSLRYRVLSGPTPCQRAS